MIKYDSLPSPAVSLPNASCRENLARRSARWKESVEGSSGREMKRKQLVMEEDAFGAGDKSMVNEGGEVLAIRHAVI